MKHLVSINYDRLSNLDKMKAIQKVVVELEIKILVYSELGNNEIMQHYGDQLKELNLLYLDAMVGHDELNTNEVV